MPDSGKIIGFIGGSGFEAALEDELGAPLESERRVRTAQGEVAFTLYATPSGNAVAFLPRHGLGHALAPHLINHHANIAALRQLGCDFAVSTTAVGSLRREYRPGDLAVPNDFLDMRSGPPTTFHDTAGSVAHTDFSEPFHPAARRALIDAAAAAVSSAGQAVPPETIIHPHATYLCVSGPRYETPAEVRCFAGWGADLVGMTVVPEAILARETGLGYATLSVVTNFGTGISPVPLAHEEVDAMMRARRPLVLAAITAACDRLAREPA